MSGYRVLLIVLDAWHSDDRTFPSFTAARRHRATVARRWNTSETAILAPDGRLLAYEESRDFQREVRQRTGRIARWRADRVTA